MFLLPHTPELSQSKKKQKAVCKQTINKANIAMYTVHLRAMYKNGINTGTNG